MTPEEEFKELSKEEKEYNLIISRELRGLPNSKELIEKYKENFEKSFQPKDVKKKKIVLTKTGKRFVAGVSLALIAGTSSICAFSHNPKIVHEREIDEANEFISENIMPELLLENGIEVINPDGDSSYNLALSIEDIRRLQESVSEKLNISLDDAQYVVFKYYNFSDELFAQYGYNSANDFCYSNGYRAGDSIDQIIANPVSIYENMHEQAIIDAVKEYKDEMGTR